MTAITPKALLDMGAEVRDFGDLRGGWIEYTFRVVHGDGCYNPSDLIVKFNVDGASVWLEIAGYMSPLSRIKTLGQFARLLAAMKGE